MISTTVVPQFEEGQKSVITLGKFDGLHRGHQKLIHRVLEIGKDGYQTVIFTFDVSPLVKLGKSNLKSLLTNEERAEMIEELGVDCLVECPFTDEVIHMEAEDFIKEFLVNRLHAACIVVGTDFRFGHERRGDVRMLEDMAGKYGYTVEIIEKERYENREISSTYIREELEKGNMETVSQLLGYTFFTKGEIVRGRQLGRTIGIPTTNIIPSTKKKFPLNGVYVTKSIIDGRVYQGITNVGYKPTVKENFLGVETYLFDCDADLYGKESEVLFFHFLRHEKKFGSMELLKEQLLKDNEMGREYFRLGYGQIKNFIL